jgi:hypothetical protein
MKGLGFDDGLEVGRRATEAGDQALRASALGVGSLSQNHNHEGENMMKTAWKTLAPGVRFALESAGMTEAKWRRLPVIKRELRLFDVFDALFDSADVNLSSITKGLPECLR